MPNEIPILGILLLAYGRIQRDANVIVFCQKGSHREQPADMSFKFRVPNYANKIILGPNKGTQQWMSHFEN